MIPVKSGILLVFSPREPLGSILDVSKGERIFRASHDLVSRDKYGHRKIHHEVYKMHKYLAYLDKAALIR